MRIERLGIEAQTVFGMPPVDYVRFASRLGCSEISISLVPPPWNPCGFPAWSLRDDPDLRRATLSVLNDTGVALSSAEGFTIRAGVSMEDRIIDLDLCYELGVSRINTVSLDVGNSATLDQLARLSELALERNMVVGLEFAPPHYIPDLQSALQTLKALDRSNMLLIIDTMHFCRSKGTAADLASVSPDLIACVQLCDAPRVSQIEGYLQEACFERLAPGMGEFPLVELLSVLPRDVLVGVETPMRAQAESGQLEQAVAHAVTSARNMMNLARQEAKGASQ